MAPLTVTNTIVTGRAPTGVAVDSSSGTVYIANSGSNTVSVLDEKSGRVVGTIPVGTEPVDIVVDPARGTGYVTYAFAGWVSVVDLQRREVTRNVQLGRGGRDGIDVAGLAVDPITGTVYVAETNAGVVAVIDGTTHAVTDRIKVREPLQVAVDPVRETVYVTTTTTSTTGGVAVIDGKANTVVRTIAGPAAAVAVDTTTNTVYITTSRERSSSLRVIDGKSGQVRDTAELAYSADRVRVDENTGTVYVLGSYPGTVYAIDGKTHQVQTVTVGYQGFEFDMDVDPVTGVVYVSSNFDNAVTVVNGSGSVPANGWEASVRGYPSVVPGDPAGFYLGVVGDAWTVQVTQPAPAGTIFTGRIVLEPGAFTNVSTTAAEPGDTFTVDGNTITFRFTSRGALDKLRFTTPLEAEAIFFELRVDGKSVGKNQIFTGKARNAAFFGAGISLARTPGQ